MRRFLRFAPMVALLAGLLLPGAASAADCQTAPSWTGTGTVRDVASGGSIQSAVDSASAGDTIRVADGTYAAFNLTKNVRVIAANRYGAKLTGGGTIATPNVAGQSAWIDGFEYTNSPIVTGTGAGSVVLINNRVLNGSGQEFRVWKPAGKITVWGNDFRDTDSSVTDYALQFYGTSGAEVCHNYIFGRWNQAVSFKEGNSGYSIGYNTLQGGRYAGFFAGQNGPNYGPVDSGPISIHHNWTGSAVTSSGTLYKSVGGIRVWHVSGGGVNIHDNVSVGGQSGFELTCGNGPVSDVDGCASGTINLINNAFAMRGTYPGGTVNGLGCLLQYRGSGASGPGTGPVAITADRTKCWDAPLTYNWAISNFTATNTVTGSNPQPLPVGPNPRFDPDLSLLGGSTPPARCRSCP